MIRRIVVPSIALVGAVLIGLAVASATVWKPAKTVIADHEIGAGADLLWTDPGVLEAWNDQVTVEVKTKAVPGVIVAVGRTNDVTKWVADSPFEQIKGLSSVDTFAVTKGGSNEKLVPAQNSDLWVLSREVTESNTIKWNHREGRWSLLIAPMANDKGEFGSLAGTTLSMTWTRTVSTPFLGKGIGLGALALAASLALLVWDIRHRRRLTLAEEREAARESGLQREAGPVISRRAQTPEETSVIKAVSDHAPILEEGGQVAPAPDEPSPAKARRGKARRGVEAGPVQPAKADRDQPAKTGLDQPAKTGPDQPAKAGPDQPTKADRDQPAEAEVTALADQIPAEKLPQAATKRDSTERKLPDKAATPLPEPSKPGESAAAQAEAKEETAPAKTRRWFGGRKKTEPEASAPIAPDEAAPEEQPAVDLGRATPVRSWERIAQGEPGKPDETPASLPVFGAKVDPVLGPIGAPSPTLPAKAWEQLHGAQPAAAPVIHAASPDEKIEALRSAHSSAASQAAATIAAAMAAAQGAGSAAGLTRRQIREAERAAHEALRTSRQIEADDADTAGHAVKMQDEEGQ